MKIHLNLNLRPKEKQSPLQSQSKGPNLLQTVVQPDSSTVSKIPILKLPFAIIVFIQVSFMLTVLYTTRLAVQIGQLKNNIDTSMEELDKKSQEVISIKNALEKTNTLKNLETENQKFKPKVELLLNNIPQNMFMSKAEIAQSKFEITITTNSAIEVSLLIDSYLKKDLGKEIVIKSANLDVSTGQFLTSLEVLF